MLKPLHRRCVLALTLLVLVGCDSKKRDGGAAQKAAPPPAKVAAMPAGNALPPLATPLRRKLVILPDAPTALDSLLAVFQGDAGRVTYRWEIDGEVIDGEERDRLAASNLKKGASITVIVANGEERYSESITIGNIPPVVSQVTFKNPGIHRGIDIELIVSGEDADGDNIAFHYKWFRNGSEIDAIDSPRLPGDQFSRGDQISFQVFPFDGVIDGSPYVGSTITIPNAPPFFVSQPLLQFRSNSYNYQAQAIDPDNDEVSYALENPPQNMTIDKKTGQISWPLAGIPAGEYRINIVADDSQGQKSYQEYSLTMSRQ